MSQSQAKVVRKSGRLETVTSSLIRGWIYDPVAEQELVDIYIDRSLYSVAQGTVARPDLVRAGYPEGQHGFTTPLAAWLRDGREHQIDVYFAGSDRLVRNGSQKFRIEDGGRCVFDLDNGMSVCIEDAPESISADGANGDERRIGQRAAAVSISWKSPPRNGILLTLPAGTRGLDLVVTASFARRDDDEQDGLKASWVSWKPHPQGFHSISEPVAIASVPEIASSNRLAVDDKMLADGARLLLHPGAKLRSIEVNATILTERPDTTWSDKLELGGSRPTAEPIPPSFQAEPYAELCGLSTAAAKAAPVRESLWSHYVSDGERIGWRPEPFFEPKWVQLQLPETRPAQSNYTSYLTGQISVDPHPFIVESYVVAQRAALRLDRREHETALRFLDRTTDLSVNPNPLFNTRHVAEALGMATSGATVLDVVRAYIDTPKAWRVSVSPLFIQERLQGVLPPDMAPLMAYLSMTSLWNASPHPLFEAEYFLGQIQDATPGMRAPLVQYLTDEVRLKRKPHPYFDPAYYARQSDEVSARGYGALEHYVTHSIGDPGPDFRHPVYFAEFPEAAFSPAPLAQFATRREQDGFPLTDASPRYAAPNCLTPPTEKRVIIQMTPVKTRNPYYGEMPVAFKAAGWDFRFSSNLDMMADDYSRKRKDLVFWFHQFDPFYHSDTVKAASQRLDALVSNLQKLRDSGNRIMHTWHNALPYNKQFVDLDHKLYLQLDRILSGVVVHTQDAVAWVRHFCPTVPIKYIPHHSFAAHFQTSVDKRLARRLTKLPGRRFIFSCVGEIKPYKGIDLLIKAWEQVQKRNLLPEAALVIAGRWSGCAEEYQTVARLGNTLTMDRELSTADIENLWASSDCCVLTHHAVWASGAGITALSFGVPCLVPRNTGMAEYVRDGDNGYLFEDHSVEALVAAMVRIHNSREREHMAFMNRALADELHPFRLQSSYAAFVDALAALPPAAAKA